MTTTTTASGEIEFVFIAESGPLEYQSILLAESIRHFGGRFSDAKLTVISPRAARRPLDSTIRRLEAMNVEYIPLNITSVCPAYGPSYKVHAMALAAARSGPPIIVQVDSDTVFLGEPDVVASIDRASARPVDVKGMCTSGPEDSMDLYWRKICEETSVDYDAIPMLETTISKQKVKASYNGGLIAVRRESGLLQLTDEMFRKIIAAGDGPWAGSGLKVKSGVEVASEAGSAYWATCQAAFSLAAVSRGIEVDILPTTYNFPLHLYDAHAPSLVEAPVHIHYHWLASENHGNKDAMLDRRLNLPLETYSWLEERLPLRDM